MIDPDRAGFTGYGHFSFLHGVFHATAAASGCIDKRAKDLEDGWDKNSLHDLTNWDFPFCNISLFVLLCRPQLIPSIKFSFELAPLTTQSINNILRPVKILLASFQGPVGRRP
jgi:hypothetical protein